MASATARRGGGAPGADAVSRAAYGDDSAFRRHAAVSGDSSRCTECGRVRRSPELRRAEAAARGRISSARRPGIDSRRRRELRLTVGGCPRWPPAATKRAARRRRCGGGLRRFGGANRRGGRGDHVGGLQSAGDSPWRRVRGEVDGGGSRKKKRRAPALSTMFRRGGFANGENNGSSTKRKAMRSSGTWYSKRRRRLGGGTRGGRASLWRAERAREGINGG